MYFFGEKNFHGNNFSHHQGAVSVPPGTLWQKASLNECMFVQLGGVGVNLKAFPSSGAPFLAAIAFHGGVAAILLLYVAFWVQVSSLLLQYIQWQAVTAGIAAFNSFSFWE